MMELLSVALFAVLPFLYLLLQVAALASMRGGLRVAAWACAAIMALAAGLAAIGVAEGSNIAPIFVFLALPPLTLVLAVLWGLHLHFRR